jgi:gentisate 1,2-dioxygenase
MMKLGTLEDLPEQYRTVLTEKNLVPLWPSLRAVLPPGRPAQKTQTTHWSYNGLKPLLLEAGKLTPIEKAERRVLVLANPGHGLEKMQATSTIYLGMQLLLPGEWAPAHKHTPNAVRMIVEGSGAYTTVSGEKCPMQKGDLILTPTGEWHEHGHDGDKPVIWLDVLDLPIIYYMETSYATEGKAQTNVSSSAERAYQRGGVVPSENFTRAANTYPLIHYPWVDVRSTLIDLSKVKPNTSPIQVAYINPETGDSCQKVLGYSALMLRPNEEISLPIRSTAMVFHVIEGTGIINIDGKTFDLTESDTCCSPGYTQVTLTNTSSESPTFIFIADDSPLQKKLGVYEERH